MRAYAGALKWAAFFFAVSVCSSSLWRQEVYLMSAAYLGWLPWVVMTAVVVALLPLPESYRRVKLFVFGGPCSKYLDKCEAIRAGFRPSCLALRFDFVQGIAIVIQKLMTKTRRFPVAFHIAAPDGDRLEIFHCCGICSRVNQGGMEGDEAGKSNPALGCRVVQEIEASVTCCGSESDERMREGELAVPRGAIVIIGGVGGECDDSHIESLIRLALPLGYSLYVVCPRGIVTPILKEPINWGSSRDIITVLDFVVKRHTQGLCNSTIPIDESATEVSSSTTSPPSSASWPESFISDMSETKGMSSISTLNSSSSSSSSDDNAPLRTSIFRPHPRCHRVQSDIPIFVVAYSLGACNLLRFLGEAGAFLTSTIRSGEGKRPFKGHSAVLNKNLKRGTKIADDTLDQLRRIVRSIKGVVSVSNPFDVDRACSRLDEPGGLTALLGGKRLRRVFHRRYFSDPQQYYSQTDLVHPITSKIVSVSRSIRECDALLSCQSWGYKNTEEYYKAASCRYHLRFLPVPTLCLNALDDPIVERVVVLESVPQASKINHNAMFVVTEKGGHNLFSESLLFDERRNFQARLAVEWIQTVENTLYSKS